MVTLTPRTRRSFCEFEAKFRRLWMIVWRMFGWFIPFPTPVDFNELT